MVFIRGMFPGTRRHPKRDSPQNEWGDQNCVFSVSFVQPPFCCVCVLRLQFKLLLGFRGDVEAVHHSSNSSEPRPLCVSPISMASRVAAIWNHPAGPKTIHFWAPTFKWGISIANIADFQKPADKISYPQQLAVTATGLIWSRYSMVITPKNWNLFSVNIAMATTGIYQLSRKLS
nr:mitochondrial pyruvate carrier 4-like isoform X2 [Physcomitrium patens]|eukprot:XP_024365545.1 mitochondrial pyruvate carrier 4-like isoform X2 [Physcomitrella patens]